MNPFNRRAALRIAAVSVLLASVVSPVAWFIAVESAEQDMVALATEESARVLHLHEAAAQSRSDAAASAQRAAESLVGGLFDIAEIYDLHGDKLAEAMTREGRQVEALLPRHGKPRYLEPGYESLQLTDGQWTMRLFVPLRLSRAANGPPSGYFEGVRIVPQWQRQQIASHAWGSALLVGLASLLCGLAIYPVVVHLSTDNARKAREVLDSHISMMEALGSAIAKRDSDTGAHNYRVAWMASKVAEHMGLKGSEMQSLIAGSFLHDVGKIGIPDSILLKPGRLNADEMATMRTHVAQGEEIVTGMGWLDGAHAVVAGHHEKWDGSGYPRGLAGRAIPLAARIFAVADVFVALCSKRPYKEAMGLEDALAILTKDTGSHFDPEVMATFLPLAHGIHQCLQDCSEAQARLLLQERIREHFGR